VLSPDEVLRLLEAAPGPKHKASLSVAYGAGLRAMEVVALKVCARALMGLRSWCRRSSGAIPMAGICSCSAAGAGD
jgi:integrase